MRLRCPFLRGLFVSLLAVSASPALSQSLLVNRGFDRDLSGWTAAVNTSPDSGPPGYVEASAGWTSSDAHAISLSGGAALHARANTFGVAKTALAQCLPVSEKTLVTFGATFLTVRQFATARPFVTASFFASGDCSGTASGFATAEQPFVIPYDGPAETNSGGIWLPLTSQAVISAGARSLRFEVGVNATGTSFYGLSYVDAVADDAFLTLTPATLTTWILPSTAWVQGAAGSYWTTRFTLCNPGSVDAAVSLKWLGHDMDGRGGSERTYLVNSGQTLGLNEEEWELNHAQDYGAILMTSSSPAVFLQSETSAYAPTGGTVGQALAAMGSADFAGATPKTLAPIRENASFRMNLVLANATSAPLTAHVALFTAEGMLVGSRDVELPPLGMTQINHVASALGAATLDAGRLAVSTSTPGGLVAAYASIIDSRTNDPRTILPR